MFYYQDWLLAKMGIAEGFYTGAKFGLKLVMITMIVKGVQILRRTEGYARQRESQVLSSVYQSGGGRGLVCSIIKQPYQQKQQNKIDRSDGGNILPKIFGKAHAK